MTRTGSIVFWFCMTIVASAALYHTSYQVQTLNRQLRDLNVQIEAEQKNLHVMQAEWMFLAGPSRVEKAAQKHLAMKPASPKQVISLAQLSDRLPTREELLAGFKLDGVPVANISTNLPAVARAKKSVAAADAGSHINTRMVMTRGTDSRAVTLPNGGLLRFASIGSTP
jgi:cell division protein FtsL